MNANQTELAAEALARATQNTSMANYPTIFAELMARGISEQDIRPRENVLTFNAWRALGRTVKRGEHGVKVITLIPVKDKDTGEVTGKRPKTAVVFHITQTTELSSNGPSGHTWHRNGTSARKQTDREYVRDPGEDAADRWNEQHGDRWLES